MADHLIFLKKHTGHIFYNIYKKDEKNHFHSCFFPLTQTLIPFLPIDFGQRSPPG